MSALTAMRPETPARLALVAALVLLALVVVRGVWLLLAGPTLPLVAPAPAPMLPGAAEAPVSIARWHLFGQAMAPTRLQDVEAPETALRLFLRGTVSADAEREGVAIIADAEGGERAYRVGETLPGGARLDAIQAGRVLIDRGGVQEQLSLPREAARSEVSGSAPRSATAPGGATTRPFVNPMISPGGPNLSRAASGLRPDLAELASQVSVMPVMENGRFAGVRLAGGRNSDLLERVGLRPTDVVTAVNGIPLDGPQRQRELIDSLRSSGSARVTVRRDGREMQLDVDLR